MTRFLWYCFQYCKMTCVKLFYLEYKKFKIPSLSVSVSLFSLPTLLYFPSHPLIAENSSEIKVQVSGGF